MYEKIVRFACLFLIGILLMLRVHQMKYWFQMIPWKENQLPIIMEKLKFISYLRTCIVKAELFNQLNIVGIPKKNAKNIYLCFIEMKDF